MRIENGLVFDAARGFVPGTVAFAQGRLCREQAGGPVLDAAGCYVLPGFVDIHIHGAAGADFCDGTPDALARISRTLAQNGVTSFLGTGMAYDEATLTRLFANAAAFAAPENGAVMRGIHMEGPFFAAQKRGAHEEKYLCDPNVAMFDRLWQASGQSIRMLDLAPELSGAEALIRAAAGRCTVSLAHTTADYDTAVRAFAAGATHATHLFNAMPPFGHREPGVVGAAFDRARYVELISDGIHLHPAMVRAVFALFGADRVCLISDAMRAAAMPDGDYSLGGQAVRVTGGKATLADGTIAGSATLLSDGVRRAVSFGVPLADAVLAATANPAKAAGLFDEVGSLTPGKRADVIVLDKDLHLRAVFAAGRRVV